MLTYTKWRFSTTGTCSCSLIWSPRANTKQNESFDETGSTLDLSHTGCDLDTLAAKVLAICSDGHQLSVVARPRVAGG